MKIEVRNARVARFASEKSVCFEATVVIEGERAGKARNDGKGGPNKYVPHRLYDRLTEFARTLPPVTSWGVPVAQTADMLVDEAVQRCLTARDFERVVRSRLLYVNDTGELRDGGRLPRGARGRATAQSFVGKPGVRRVLNVLPKHEALDIFREKVRA